jgi:pimeloyl-ACP methyl ester carboxylesterase
VILLDYNAVSGGVMKPCYIPLVFLSLLLLVSCIPATTIPIGTTFFHRSEKVERRSLVVFLPGRGDTVSSYEKEGFPGMLTQRGDSIDTVGVGAHLGYYVDRTLLQRLREDVIIPAKADGYSDIWLVGISMGGLGAILYDSAYPGDISGLFLLAPYLGDGTLLKEISAVGGLAAWQPIVGTATNLDNEIWPKLKGYTESTKNSGRVFLGFGESDRFAATNRVFGRVLPTAQVVTVPGGHDWRTWRALWPKLLERSLLQAGGGK